jgi:membrane protein YdbS with pleckstrin-like domain
MEQENKNVLQSRFGKDVARVLVPGEQLILNIHQHVIILLKYGFFTILACMVFLVSAGFLFKSITVIDATTMRLIIIILAALTVIIMFIILYVISMAYAQTILVITDRSVVQVVQKGLLFHKVGRLSMADVEDVSSEQLGILTRLFGYGTLTIQTAGEKPNFVFKYCTNPVHITEIILNARDQYNDDVGNEP